MHAPNCLQREPLLVELHKLDDGSTVQLNVCANCGGHWAIHFSRNPQNGNRHVAYCRSDVFDMTDPALDAAVI